MEHSRPFSTTIASRVIGSMILVLAWVASHLQPVAQTNTGAIQGVVTFQGIIPESAVPDDAGFRRPLLSVDSKSRGLEFAVVYLEFVKGAAPSQHFPTNRSAAPAVDQRDHTFAPHVIAVRAGEEVTFTNSDAANHNVRTITDTPTNQFNVYTGQGASYKHRFGAMNPAEPVRLGCDIHPWMRGWIYAFDHRWFAITDEKGRFAIHHVPAGEHTLVVRQPDIRFSRSQSINVVAGKTNVVNVEVRGRDTP